MSAEIVCPHCQTRYPARADLYGRRVACKTCKQPFTAEAPASAPRPNETSANQIVCPHCDARYPARADLYGRRVACKTCKQAFTPEAPAARATDFASGGLLDDVISESATAERVEREPDPEAEKPKKKKKKKKSLSLPFAMSGYASETKFQIIVLLSIVFLPTALAILTRGWRPAAALAAITCFLTLISTTFFGFAHYVGRSENAAMLVILSCMFSPVLVIITVLGLIACFEDYPPIPLAFFSALICLLAMGFFAQSWG